VVYEGEGKGCGCVRRRCASVMGQRTNRNASLIDGFRPRTLENAFEHEKMCLQILIQQGHSARLNPSI